jgi:hypothetical protein
MEFIIKIFLTVAVIVIIFFCVISLRWIWRSQIDVKETGRQLLNTPKRSMDWVATRDTTKIYQEGKIVGTICGEVKEFNNQIIFKEICNTEQLNKSEPIEYKRDKLKIVSTGGISGGKIVVTTERSTSKKSIISDVVCEKIK